MHDVLCGKLMPVFPCACCSAGSSLSRLRSSASSAAHLLETQPEQRRSRECVVANRQQLRRVWIVCFSHRRNVTNMVRTTVTGQLVESFSAGGPAVLRLLL